MRRTPVRRLALVALAVTAVVHPVLRVVESRGGTLLPVPLLAVLVVLGIAGVVLRLGWSVRQYTRGEKPGLDPLLAARTVVLATASAYTGALLTGWYLAHALVPLGDLGIEARRDLALSAGVAGLATVGLVVAGLVVERWCEIRRDEDDPGAADAEATGNPV
ncbi:DUF3180 domain-containing protein [Actinotalea sp. BY-33]|uniref:DUF3180 domain-containing protein n=1 Tax=Actinotalea soli TaxID=2819234 RepID=A0A939LQQ9_9CELL|nr:DUF3180 domain-containing protein [Actinotalea soli]MBO1752982.1 DUF3180 domain-containing protein [Actinotalea soli]